MVSVEGVLSYLAQVGVVLALLVSLGITLWVTRPHDEWKRRLRSRFILGIPWGTLVVLIWVLLVYLLVQDGITDWNNPLRLPFSSWSYSYPLGWFFAAFSHASPGHLVGNLTATLVLAPLAEYLWGHYSSDPGKRSSPSWLTHPYVRAFVLFPFGVFVVGILTALFSWGPVIGFSGVVFAFAGFALIRYPIVTIVALSARSAVRTVHLALVNPVVVTEASPQFVRPSWAGIAIQGHALGLFLGIVAAIVVLWHRDTDERPEAVRLWLGSVLVGMALTLWAIWWVRGEDTYVLFRGLGVVLVFAFATVVTLGTLASDNRIWGSITRRQVGVIVLLLPLLVMCFVAVPLNLLTVADAEPPESAVTVGDYAVFYDVDVENRFVSVVNVSVVNETTSVTTSGVIVVSEERDVWYRAVSRSELAFQGRATVHVGGLGWRDAVHVERRGWLVAGNDTVYQVWLEHDGDRRHAFATNASTAHPILDGNRVAIGADGGTFHVEVRNGGEVDRTEIPSTNESVEVGTLTIVRDDDDLIASYDETEVRIASKETYR